MRRRWECSMCAFPQPCVYMADMSLEYAMPIPVCVLAMGAANWVEVGIDPPPQSYIKGEPVQKDDKAEVDVEGLSGLGDLKYTSPEDE